MYANEPIKILILSGDLGDGHRQAAQALKEAAAQVYTNAEIAIVDFLEWTYPHFHTVGKQLFIQGIRKFPSVYGYLFQKTRRPSSLSTVLQKLFIHGLAKSMNLLNEFRPDIVVSTLPAAASAMSLLKKNGCTDVRTATVVTDHTDHSYWIHPYTDQYIVGSQQVRTSLRKLGIDDHQISVTGIPVRAKFCRSYDRALLSKKHGFDPAIPTVLVMGGGYGLISEELFELMKTDHVQKRLQIIVVCGHNERLKTIVEQLSIKSMHHIKVTGYVDCIHEFMAISDVIITKAGGLTTSEAIAQELPILIFNPLPGQEQDNTNFLLRAGVAMRADDKVDLMNKLSTLLYYPHILSNMKKNARLLKMKGAALHAVESIIQTYHPRDWVESASV